MKRILKLPPLALLLLYSGAWAGTLTTEEKVQFFYPNIVKQVQNHGLSGPIAHEVAKYAQLRTIHEDGSQRPHNISYNGMGKGSPSKEIVAKLYCPDCKITTTATDDGVGSYGVIGPRAHIMSSTLVALWYDHIILSDRFRICNEAEKKIWKESKWCSHQLAIGNPEVLFQIRYDELRDKRLKILKKVNNAYGPAGDSIHQQRSKIWPR